MIEPRQKRPTISKKKSVWFSLGIIWPILTYDQTFVEKILTFCAISIVESGVMPYCVNIVLKISTTPAKNRNTFPKFDFDSTENELSTVHYKSLTPYA